MKAIFLIPILLIWFTAQRAEAQTYMWYHAFGGIDTDHPNHLSLDHLGNTYIAGTFYSPVFNAGPLSVTGGAFNFFVLKLDAAGDPVLLRKGHTAGIMSKRIYADSKENFYLIATYLGQPFLIQNQPLPYCSWGGESGLIVKYNAQGQIMWHKSLLCNEHLESVIGHVVAGDNDIIVAGNGFDSLHCQLSNQTKWEYQLNIRSLDSLGNTKWEQSLHSPQTSHNTRIQFRQIHIGDDNHIYIAGLKHYDTLLLNGLYFDSSPYKVFILRMDTTGVIHDHFYVESDNAFDVNDIAVDSDGNLFLGGYFYDTVFQIQGMPLFVNTSPTTPNQELFLARFTPQGNPVWVNTIKGASGAHTGKWSINIGLDDAGNVYRAGDIFGPVLYLSSGISLPTTNPTGGNTFILRFDSTGNLSSYLLSSYLAPVGSYPSYPVFAVVGVDDVVFSGASLPGNPLFGGVTVNGFGGIADVFVGRFSMIIDLPKTERGEISLNLYPNPVTDDLNVEFRSGELSFPTKIRILDLHGREIESRNLPANETRTAFSCKHLSPGVYLLHISGNQVDVTRKFLINR